MSSKVLFMKKYDASWIILNRPEKLNAFDEESWMLLNKYIEDSQYDDSIAIVITGTGRAFSAGDDINSMLSLSTKKESINFFTNLMKAVEAMLNSEKPIIAAVNGLAYGGGCEILMAADIVIATIDSRFAIPEGRIGLIPPIAISIGYAALGRSIIDLALTGRELNADEALRIGLIDYVVPSQELTSKVINVLNELKKVDPTSIKTIKRYLNKNRNNDIKNAIKELALLALGESSKNRMQRFIEERANRKSGNKN
ncbi:MAG: enoyl-CoA hydratase [Thermocladium sp. ECH_B]|jgi:enoyl-CoA hydratase/carnithine racemase|nr:MAG: enoyl-CoA hydratase [Thermocladium sp. ECH_B]